MELSISSQKRSPGGSVLCLVHSYPLLLANARTHAPTPLFYPISYSVGPPFTLSHSRFTHSTQKREPRGERELPSKIESGRIQPNTSKSEGRDMQTRGSSRSEGGHERTNERTNEPLTASTSPALSNHLTKRTVHVN
jgi:hypothetical protein